MARQRKLTLIELLVIVGLVALAVHSVLHLRISRVPAPGGERAEAIRCRSNLRNWAIIFAMYTQDNDGYFFSGGDPVDGPWWLEATRPMWQTWPQILRCPTATESNSTGDPKALGVWKVRDDVCSYGLNGWIRNPPPGETELWGRGPADNYWRNRQVEGASEIPLLLDASCADGWPREKDLPRAFEDWPRGQPDQDTINANEHEMRRFCTNRHEGCVNALFMDFTVRRVGLKELWTLKWHRNYNVNGLWTQAGGVMPSDWPLWMKEFKEY